ncbi:hypothetical protein MHJ82_01160 [Corynebacterium afermentans]|uniref:hypothetical protein n=1 Tax=Corynebacterium afermentans TaxID=38286 RepID=UPI002573CAA2|nr:hypothetical protein [Corynebacterium afermentans]MCG7272952.1 hypothetical protein [Corynebacterium afermentans]
MAKSVRSRRTVIAAGALSLALVAPFVSPVQAQETTTPTSDAEPAPAEQPSTSEGTTAATFEQRFDTANFWNADEAVVEGLQLQPGDTVAPRANTIFNWGFNNNDGTLTLIRPKSTAAFGAGKKDIPVRVTTAAGETFDTTLRVNIIDERPGAEWESQLTSRYPMDFGKSTSAQSVEGITLPEGVSVSKSGAALPTGWTVSNDGTTIRVTPPTTFKDGDFDLPIEVNDGTDTFKATLRIAAKNPSKTPAETAGTVASILGPILGSLIGAGTGGGLLGNLGDIIGGGNGGSEGGTSGGDGGTSGGGAGRLINVVITNNANPSNIGNNNGSPNVVITDNVNPRDNLSNNGNPSMVITNNANPVITGNANPSVVITGNVNDNLRENGSNNSVVVTDNANPVVTDNANPVITGNANPVITGNANDNGSNNSAVVTNNANPTVVITGNANPVVTGNANDNGSNNSAVVTGNANPVVTNNANPTVVVTGNANNNGSNNSAVVTGNANPMVTGNANGGLVGFGSSRKGQDENGDHLIDANVGVDGGSSDPRCIASLVGLGLPLIAMVPLALAGQVNVPGLNDIGERAEQAFNDAARQFNIEPAQLTAASGAAIGVVAALLLTAAVRTCIPRVNGVDVSVGGSSNGNDKPAATVAAPVVETRQS